MRTIRVGDAQVSIINLGDLDFKLMDVSSTPESEWRNEGYSRVYENAMPYPSQCFYISLPNLSLLVDAGDFVRFAKAGPEYVNPNYKTPPSLVDSLSDLGVSREEVNYVVITHAHYDHYAGVSMLIGTDGKIAPTFPAARHLLGAKDFESAEIQTALRDLDSDESKSLGVILKYGLLELVDDIRELSDEVEIISAPGETPGHMIVKLVSNGETLYCLGDLFHHSVEVSHPTWMAKWDDPKTNLASRLKLIDQALKEKALIAPSHMPLGHLENDGNSVRFIEETLS